ncbi:MAG: ABC transporter substrate-binding protein [Chloroflexi bacterium]|nr:ABC transporter substrate-binding protein [Chloroflexota bacterium]MCL5109909.1 ABC transporter substrate-binding protein [Chloroflexota bacterium]
MQNLSRRQFLARVAVALGAGSALLAACQEQVLLPQPTEAIKPAASAGPAAPTASPLPGAIPLPAAAKAPAVAPDGVIVVGFNCPVTGASARAGALQLKAMNLALRQINTSGIKGSKLSVVVQDNQSTDQGALAALRKSIEQDNALVLLGTATSTQVLAMSDQIKNYGVPTVIGATSASLTKQGNQWLFRARPDDSIVAATMVKYIKEDLKLSKVGILHEDGALGTASADLVELGCRAAGLTLARREKYTTGSSDFGGQLQAFKDAAVEIVVVFGTKPEDVAGIQRRYRQLSSPFKYIGSPASASRDTLNLAKEAAVGLLAVTDFVPGASAESKTYGEAYSTEYGEPLDPNSAWAYDGLKVLAEGIRMGGEDRARIREAILGLKGYKGVQGTFNFTPNGDGLSEASVVEIPPATGSDQVPVKLLKVVNVAG